MRSLPAAAHRATARSWPLWLLLSAAFAGCLDTETAQLEGPVRPDWNVGDRWLFQRTVNGGEPLPYVREVTGLRDVRGQMAYELTSGLVGSPIDQRSYHTVSRLGFLGSDQFRAGELIVRLTSDQAVPLQYVLPLHPGTETLHGTVFRHESFNPTGERTNLQEDEVLITTHVGPLTSHTIGERVFSVYPYEVRLDVRSTPFPEADTFIRGHWAPAIQQSVDTEFIQGGTTTRYEFVNHDAVAPHAGLPHYELAAGGHGARLENGLEARLEAPGHARWLFHVTTPSAIGIRTLMGASVPASEDTRVRTLDAEAESLAPTMAPAADTAVASGKARITMVALRPLGTSGAWVDSDDLAMSMPGSYVHWRAYDTDGSGFEKEVRWLDAKGQLVLEPGVIYELVLATNHDPVHVRLSHGSQTEVRPPVDGGPVHVLRFAYEEVQRETAPGPRDHRDAITHVVVAPPHTRVEGLLFAETDPPSDLDALVEQEPERYVEFASGGYSLRSDRAVYAPFFGGTYVGSEMEVSYVYRSAIAATGTMSYRLGAAFLAFGSATA